MLSNNENRPSLGIIGFGAFGRLMARHLWRHFRLRVYDPGLTATPPAVPGDTIVTGLADAAGATVVVLATPVAALGDVLDSIVPHLRPGALVLDVGSVKMVPARLMAERLPLQIDVVATHPLFGPQSARNGIRGQKIVLCPIRAARPGRLAAFLRKTLGLTVVFATPEEHDREMATAQGLTHLIAQVLVRCGPLPSRMTTSSFDLLVQATEMVRHDSPEVFRAITQANPYAGAVRRRFFEQALALEAEIEDDARPARPRRTQRV